MLTPEEKKIVEKLLRQKRVCLSLSRNIKQDQANKEIVAIDKAIGIIKNM